MSYVLGIDLGTSGVKTALFDEKGTLAASRTVDYPLYQPKNGWAEQGPSDWWNGVCRSVSQLIKSSGISPGDIASVGLSGQMHGLVLLDGAGEVIRPAILWCDGRTGPQCAELTRRVGRERLIALSGNPALPGFTAGKILWCMEQEPESMARCRMILLPKDYIRFKLTGRFAIDPGDASGMNLLDIKTRRWSRELTQALGLDPALLPPVVESCAVAGTVTPEAAALTGLLAGTPVACGSGDNACAAAGTGVVTEGAAFTTLGSSGVVYAHSNRPVIDPAGRVHTFCSAVPGGYALLGCTLAAGQSLKWFKNTLCQSEMEQAGEGVYALLDEMAAAVPAGANGLIFLPYLLGERSPVLDERCRGVFFGLSAIHTKADMLRAVLEGVAYSQRACFEVLTEHGVGPQTMLACGGGGTSPLWRQMLADNYGLPVRVIKSEGAALGAALMGAVSVGMYEDLPSACAAAVTPGEAQQPQRQEAYERTYQVYKSLYPALREAFSALADIREGI